MSRPSEDLYPDDFMRVYHQTVKPLYGYVSRRSGGCRELAEDVTQETYLRAVSQWRDGRIPENPEAWLKFVARNLLINHFERKNPRALDPATLERVLECTSEDERDAAALVHLGLARLGRARTRVLEAYYLEGKAVRTIAEEMNLSERAVEGRLRRSRHALRKQLNGHVDFSGDPA